MATHQEEKTTVVDNKPDEPSPAAAAAEEQPQPQAQASRRAAPAAAAASPFDFSTMMNLLNDPSIKEMAEQIAKDPSFSEMAEQLQRTVAPPSSSPAPAAAALDPHKYVSTMQQLMQNPQFVAMAERLGSALMQDPAMSSMLGGLTGGSGSGAGAAQRQQLEARVARMKEDPSLRPILDEIESGGPAAMMKYWNDPEALQKFGRAMGVGPSSAAAGAGEEGESAAAAAAGAEEEEEEYEPESAIHQAASVGDVEARNHIPSPQQAAAQDAAAASPPTPRPARPPPRSGSR